MSLPVTTEQITRMDTNEFQIKQLVRFSIERFGYKDVSRFARSQGLAMGRSSKDSINKLAEQLSQDAFQSSLEQLNHEYRRHILFGDKSVQFYQVTSEAMVALVDKFSQFHPESDFTAYYPFPLPDDALESHYQSNRSIPVPLGMELNGLALVFASVRYFSMQFELEPSSFSDDEILREYDQLIGRKFTYRQFFDSIILRPEKNIIEFVVDSPNTTEQSQSKQQRDNAFKLLHKWLLSFTHDLIEDTDFLPQAPINLIHAITPLCRDTREGLLRMCYFVTDEALDDHAFAKESERDKNLRDDSFLRNGELAVPIEIYRGMVAWPQPQRAVEDYIPHLELHLLGSKPRTSGRGNVTLNDAIIRGARSDNDYVFLCRKLFKHLDYDY